MNLSNVIQNQCGKRAGRKKCYDQMARPIHPPKCQQPTEMKREGRHLEQDQFTTGRRSRQQANRNKSL
ncbi:hypothetical protein B0H19DRAFT_1138585, partial [Mycena capillaripes]